MFDASQITVNTVSGVPGPETEDATGDPVVITRYLYKPTAREGLTRFNDNKRLHVFVVGIDGGEIRQLTEGTYYEHSIDWSPNGEEILFVSNREPDPDRFFNYDVFAVKASGGNIRRLTRTENIEYQPRWSPDGKTIVFSAMVQDSKEKSWTFWQGKWDVASRKEILAIELPDVPDASPDLQHLSWSPDKGTLAGITTDSFIYYCYCYWSV